MPLEINGYPLSHEACAITLAHDGYIIVHMPGTRKEKHSIRVAPNGAGMHAIVTILKERAARLPENNGVSGNMNAPTQQIVDKWLQHNSPSIDEKTEKARIKPKVDITPSQVDELLDGIFEDD